MPIAFTKMHGTGNDYVLVDAISRAVAWPPDLADWARRISHRRLGVGSDGLILILPSDTGHARMRMFNADGSEAEMCGNGLRCVAKFLFDRGLCRRQQLKIETAAGLLGVQLQVAGGQAMQVTVDMGVPELDPARIPTTIGTDRAVHQPLSVAGQQIHVTCLALGNPHCVVFTPSVTDEMVLAWGPALENDPHFPARTNVEFVEVISRSEVRQRTWERGSGETWACGTGASAACVAAVLNGYCDRRLVNHLLGGDLLLEWHEATNRVSMTGPAAWVFDGEWPPDGA